LLALRRSKPRTAVHGQQAGLSESGSKLPHSRVPAVTPSLNSRRPGRVASNLPTVSLRVLLGVIFGLAWPSGAIVASAAVQGSQDERPATAATTPQSPPALPKTCLEPARIKGNVADMLDAVRDHPTAGAWNTLGALYAQRGAMVCAIPSFQEALRLQPDSQEARYNLALAWIRSGQPAKAREELQTLIQQNPQFAGAHLALGALLEGAGKLDAAESEYDAAIRADAHFYVTYLNLAQLLDAQGKYPAAISHLEEALALNPPQDVADQLEASLAKTYAESGDLDKAQEVLGKLVAAYPNSAGAHLNMGTVQAQKRSQAGYIAAVKEYREALRLDPHRDDARLALARVLIELGRYSDAAENAALYTRHKPQDYAGYYVQGLADEGLAMWSQAVEALRRADHLHPGDFQVHYNLGLALAHSGETADAVRELRAAETINSQDADVHSQLAMLLEKLNDKDGAQAERQQSQTLKEHSSQASTAGQLNNQANQWLAEGKVQEAVEAYRKALQLSPNYAQAHYNLSLALDKLGELGEERQQLEETVKLDPKFGIAHDQLGLLALRGGKVDKAEQEFKSALLINPRDAEAQDSLGVLYSLQGNDAQAATMFQRSMESDPKYAKAYLDLGMTLAKKGQYVEAERQFQTAIKIAPDDQSGYTGLGMLLAKTGREAEAIPSFRKAVALDPGSPDARVNLGIALADQYDLAGGLAEFREAIRLDPHSAKAYYNLGRFYFYTGKYVEARKELETACQIQPDYPDALYSLALDERQLNNVPRATELLQRVVTLTPGNADAQYLLGQNLDRMGKKEEAIAHWRIAAQADPDQSQSLYNLARALEERHDPEAQQYMERFQALEKSHRLFDRVQALGNFAIEAANAQNWPQAVEQMKEAIQLCGQCAEGAHLHRNLGLIYCRTGNRQDGEKELRAALELDPRDQDARKALAQLANLPPAPQN